MRKKKAWEEGEMGIYALSALTGASLLAFSLVFGARGIHLAGAMAGLLGLALSGLAPRVIVARRLLAAVAIALAIATWASPMNVGTTAFHAVTFIVFLVAGLDPRSRHTTPTQVGSAGDDRNEVMWRTPASADRSP
jgi:hypothetical protein